MLEQESSFEKTKASLTSQRTESEAPPNASSTEMITHKNRLRDEMDCFPSDRDALSVEIKTPVVN